MIPLDVEGLLAQLYGGYLNAGVTGVAGVTPAGNPRNDAAKPHTEAVTPAQDIWCNRCSSLCVPRMPGAECVTPVTPEERHRCNRCAMPQSLATTGDGDTATPVTPATPLWNTLPLDIRECFEERAAIMEYDGGLARAEAERQAWACLKIADTTEHTEEITALAPRPRVIEPEVLDDFVARVMFPIVEGAVSVEDLSAANRAAYDQFRNNEPHNPVRLWERAEDLEPVNGPPTPRPLPGAAPCQHRFVLGIDGRWRCGVCRLQGPWSLTEGEEMMTWTR